MKNYLAAAALVCAFCPLAPAADKPACEWRLDFKSVDDVKNVRLTAHKDIEIQHRSDGRAGAGCMSVNNRGRATQFLSIRCDDFCDDGEGVLVSMWVKKEKSGDAKSRCGLSLKCVADGGKDDYVSLSSVPMADDKWTLLSGWHYRGAKAGRPLEFKVAVAPGATVLIDDMVLIRSSIAQPPDKRSPLVVKGAHVTEGDKRFVLHGVNLYGCSDDEKDDTHHVTSSVTEDDYRDIAAAGFNCVRLNAWHKVFREDGGWEWLKLHGLWARRHGLRIILDMHSPPGGYQSNEYKGKFWKSPQMQQDLIDFWVQAANMFKDDPVIAAFDIMNEPKPPKDKDWLAFASRALAEMRKAGWNRPVIVESSMSTLEDGWSAQSQAFADGGVIYDTHFYTPWSFTYSAKSSYGKPCVDYGKSVLAAAFIRENLDRDLLDFAAANNVPVNVGEFGVSGKALSAGGDRWLTDVMGIMNERGVGRQYFCWCVYGDFGIETGWFRQSSAKRNETVLKILQAAKPK
jgi:hypothetical protein